MRAVESELDTRRVAVAVVTFDSGPIVETWVRQTEFEWPLLLDTKRDLYRTYGMLRGRAWDLYGPPAIWAYLKLMARGRWLRRPGSDVTQLGGDVLVDPEGVVRLHHVGSGPADRPSISSIVDRVATPSPA